MDDKPPRSRKPRAAGASMSAPEDGGVDNQASARSSGGAEAGTAKAGSAKTGSAKTGSAKVGSPQGAAVKRGATRATDPTHLTGQLLIAMPMMDSPHFVHSVIYVCAHTPEGAMGIVLNSPLESPSFDDLLAQLGVAPTPPSRRIGLCKGGPVESARGFVLHTADWTGDGSLVVDESVALTASLDVLKAIADGGGPREGLLALGYAGWGPGQLDSEMQQNAWLSAPADVGLVFDQDHATKWRRALAVLKVDPVLLSEFSGRA